MPDDASVKFREEIEQGTGFRIVGKDEAEQTVQIYKEYNAARSPRYKDMVENDRFYHGVHYDETEEAEIIGRGQAPIPINVTYSLIKQMISLLTGNNPIWYVDPVSDADKKYAYLMRQLLEGTWYNSRGSRQFSQIAKECAVVGHGIGMVSPTSDPVFGVKFMHVPYHQVFFSGNTREFTYEDSENVVIAKTLSYRQIANFMGKPMKWVEDHANALDEFIGDAGEDAAARYPRYSGPVTSKDEEGSGKVAQVFQRFTMESANIYIVKPTDNSGFKQRVFFQLPEYIRKGAARGQFEITEHRNAKVVAKYLSVGDYCEKYYLPITNYPIVPFIDEFNGNPYPLGEVDFLYGIQRALNKFILLAILNATLSNNMKVMAVKGSIDKDNFAENYAIPAALIEYEWREGAPAPQQVNPVPLNSEFYAFPRHLISMMEYITGIFGVVQGNPEGAPRTASGLMSLQNYGGQKVKLLARNMQDALSALGDVAIQLYQNYAPYNGTMNYIPEGENEVRTVEYNKLRAVGGNVAVENDISSGKYRTRVKVVQNYGSEREMKANLLANLAAQTKSPVLIKPILKLADIPEADEILKELEGLEKAQQTVQQLQEQMQRLQQVNTQMENELLRKGRQLQLKDTEVQLAKFMEKLKAETGVDVSNAVAEFKMSLKEQQMSMGGSTNEGQT